MNDIFETQEKVKINLRGKFPPLLGNVQQVGMWGVKLRENNLGLVFVPWQNIVFIETAR